MHLWKGPQKKERKFPLLVDDGGGVLRGEKVMDARKNTND